jgi:hypothetical protein
LNQKPISGTVFCRGDFFWKKHDGAASLPWIDTCFPTLHRFLLVHFSQFLRFFVSLCSPDLCGGCVAHAAGCFAAFTFRMKRRAQSPTVPMNEFGNVPWHLCRGGPSVSPEFLHPFFPDRI